MAALISATEWRRLDTFLFTSEGSCSIMLQHCYGVLADVNIQNMKQSLLFAAWYLVKSSIDINSTKVESYS